MSAERVCGGGIKCFSLWVGVLGIGAVRVGGEREEKWVAAMIVSGESKTGQTHGRVRNPRRLGESDARSRESVVQSAMTSRVRGMTSSPIMVDDEDDDVVVSSPRAFAQAKLVASVESRRSTRHRVVVEDDLELRLGPGPAGGSQYSVRTQSSITQPPRGRRGRPARATIDLTTPSRPSPAIPVLEDCVLLNDDFLKSRKRKSSSIEQSLMHELALSTPANEPEEGCKLKCAICMDTMKEEVGFVCLVILFLVSWRIFLGSVLEVENGDHPVNQGARHL